MGTLYKVGQRVELRSGKKGTIRRVLVADPMPHLTRYQVRLENDRQLIGIDGLDVIKPIAPFIIPVAPNQSVVLNPQKEEDVSQFWLLSLRRAFKDSWDRLTRVQLKLVQALSDVQTETAPSPEFQLAMAICFRLPPPTGKHTFEDYRRALEHVLPLMKSVLRGLSEDGLPIVDVPVQYKVQPNGSTVGGLVPLGVFEGLRMWWNGEFEFHSFKSTDPLYGPIHMNFGLLAGKPWHFTDTLIHEATHKFCRTVDNHYLSDKMFTNLRPLVTMGMFDMVESTLKKLDEKNFALTAMDALNNADSYSKFIMWVSDHA